MYLSRIVLQVQWFEVISMTLHLPSIITRKGCESISLACCRAVPSDMGLRGAHAIQPLVNSEETDYSQNTSITKDHAVFFPKRRMTPVPLGIARIFIVKFNVYVL